MFSDETYQNSISEMNELIGMTTVIIGISGYVTLNIDQGYWCWCDSWLEKIKN